MLKNTSISSLNASQPFPKLKNPCAAPSYTLKSTSLKCLPIWSAHIFDERNNLSFPAPTINKGGSFSICLKSIGNEGMSGLGVFSAYILLNNRALGNPSSIHEILSLTPNISTMLFIAGKSITSVLSKHPSNSGF